MDKGKLQSLSSWLFLGAIFILCGVLGVLQYRWIGEVNLAARDRLRASLQANLTRFSQDFDSEISTAWRAILIGDSIPDAPGNSTVALRAAIAQRYRQWTQSSRHAGIFDRVAVAEIGEDTSDFALLDFNRERFQTQPWPADWEAIRKNFVTRFSPEGWQEGPRQPTSAEQETLVFELPRFPMGPGGGARPFPFERRQATVALFHLNLSYIRNTLVPELLQRHLGASGTSDYQVEILTQAATPAVIFQSDPDPSHRIAGNADVAVPMFDPQREQFLRRRDGGGPRDAGRGNGRPPIDARRPGRENWRMPPMTTPMGARQMPGPADGPEMGLWRIYVRHRAGSLEAAVGRARWRNLSVTTGVLLLMIATAGALIRYTRRAQKLADMQLDFVAGVSHELRTPLTVIHTAAYNLRGNVATNPVQVERYGALIQQETGRLKDLVEQILRFARISAGHAIQNPEPVSVATVVEETLESCKPVIQNANCDVEKEIEEALPEVLGDAMSLKHALQNLITNAAKYGADGSRWIGVFVTKVEVKGRPEVEIRVVDHGPGIPADEQKQIFDAFFRGQRAMRDQIHGTGLGLNLAQRIVHAHGGTIHVKSVPFEQTEFIVRLPAAPDGVTL